jgi:hypothetical protein
LLQKGRPMFMLIVMNSSPMLLLYTSTSLCHPLFIYLLPSKWLEKQECKVHKFHQKFPNSCIS